MRFVPVARRRIRLVIFSMPILVSKSGRVCAYGVHMCCSYVISAVEDERQRRREGSASFFIT